MTTSQNIDIETLVRQNALMLEHLHQLGVGKEKPVKAKRADGVMSRGEFREYYKNWQLRKKLKK